MNCLRISPGTSRKPGAILRKCAAQPARSICGGSLYKTIAVIIVRVLLGGAGAGGRTEPVFILASHGPAVTTHSKHPHDPDRRPSPAEVHPGRMRSRRRPGERLTAMTGWPSRPVIYEINTAVWLT